jgi:VWFA-related protein
MALNAIAVCGQTPPQSNTEPKFQIKTESNLVVLRVVVRDNHGKPVTDLKKEDFKVFDRGKEQVISQFEETLSAIPSDPAQGSDGANAPTASVSTAAERLLVLYFDDLNTKQDDLIQARDAADRFLSANLARTDRVAIFSTDKMLSDLTSDRDQIHRALAQLNGTAHAVSRMRQCPEISDLQAEQILDDNNLQSSAWTLAISEYKVCHSDPNPNIQQAVLTIRSMSMQIHEMTHQRAIANLQSLEQITRYLARMPGQRTIVLVSPGFLSHNEQSTLDRIIDSALRAQIVISSFDPKGLAVTMRATDASRNTNVLANEKAIASAFTLDSQREFTASDVLAELAYGTGGQFFHNDNDLSGGFDALAGHPDYYTLAFSPKDLKQDGKFHELKVTLATRPKGFMVQARKGYYQESAKNVAAQEASLPAPTLPPPSVAAAPSQTAPGPAQSRQADPQAQAQERIRQALQSPEDRKDFVIGIDTKVLPAPSGGDPQLAILTHLELKSDQSPPILFKQEGDTNQNNITFAVALVDETGKVLTVKQRLARIKISAQELKEMTANGIEVTMNFPVKPGKYKVRAVVTESESQRLSIISSDLIDIP